MPRMPVESVSHCPSPRELRDRDLVDRFLGDREESAFGELVARHGGLVMAVAWRVLRDRHAAEDVFQATFLILAQQAKSIRNRESLAAWLHGTAFRVARKSLARRQRRRECAMPPDESAAAFDELAKLEEQTALDEELARMPEPIRGPLLLHYLQDKSAAEIAEELGLSVSCVEGRLRRGRRELQLRLVRRGIGISAVVTAANILAAPAEAAVAAPLVSATAKACIAAATGATLPPLISPEATHLAARELILMSRATIMKTTLLWSSVVGGVAAVGVISAEAHLPRASAEGQPGITSVVDDDADDGAEFGGGTLAGGSAAPPQGGTALIEDGGGGIGVLGGAAPGAGGGAGLGGDTNWAGGGDGTLNPDTGVIGSSGLSGSGGGAGVAGAGEPPQGDQSFGAMMMGGGMSGGMSGGMGGPMTSPGAGPADSIVDYALRKPNEQRILASLKEPIALNFVDTGLSDAMTYISGERGIPIRLDRKRLAEQGVADATPISIEVGGVSLASALRQMLDSVEGASLDYLIQDEVLQITTQDYASEQVETRVYDVRDFGTLTPDILARVIRNSVALGTWIPQSRGSASMVSAAGMMSGMLGGGGGMGVPIGGDERGWIEAIDGALIVTQSQPAHREIVGLLDQLALHASSMRTSRTMSQSGPGAGGSAPDMSGKLGYSSSMGPQGSMMRGSGGGQASTGMGAPPSAPPTAGAGRSGGFPPAESAGAMMRRAGGGRASGGGRSSMTMGRGMAGGGVGASGGRRATMLTTDAPHGLVNFGALVVGGGDSGQRTYLSIALEVDQNSREEVENQVRDHRPELQDWLVNRLSGEPVDTLTTPEVQNTLKESIRDAFNGILYGGQEGSIRRVLITETGDVPN
ncbi:MAG: sigma-70 family RNA polymerase sigma factor [Planctomyces sp.]|nr:sigma-70 family RNA polymerase sigma factor [Planctomyces sp.]